MDWKALLAVVFSLALGSGLTVLAGYGINVDCPCEEAAP